MLEHFSLYYGLDDETEIPEGEDRMTWLFRQEIRSKCELPEAPPHDLSPEIADQIRFIRNDIALLLPENFTRHDAFRMFLQHEKPGIMPHYMLDRHGEVIYDWERTEASFEASRYLPYHWDISAEDLLTSYERSLDSGGTKRPGYVEFPARDRVEVQLGIRRTPKPDAQTIAEGLYYHQFVAEEWHWDSGSPQLFAAIEKNLEGRKYEDPFEWARARASIAAGYSVVGGGKDCSPLFLAEVYERMASTACNPPPVGHDRPIVYDVDEEEQALLIELYARHDATVGPEMVYVILEHAPFLTPELIAKDPVITRFLEHLPEMLQNGLNIDRITEYTHEPSVEGAVIDRLRSAMCIAESVYRGQKPWWFKEDFNFSSYFAEPGEEREGFATMLNDGPGRALLERIARASGFALAHTISPYIRIGYRLQEIAPFTEEDAIAFTAAVVQHYGIGNGRRAIEVLQHCQHILRQEESARRADRLASLTEHLDEVQPQTAIMGSLEAENPVFELPGVTKLATTFLGKGLIHSPTFHNLRLDFQQLAAIDAQFALPLGERARRFAPALPDGLQAMERKGLLPGQSTEAQLALPVPLEMETQLARGNPVLGIFDFYAQLKQECGSLDEKTASSYFLFSAARMPDPWHPPKGFLKFLQIFNEIDTPGWRFTGLEHPRDRDRVSLENSRGEAVKQMLVSNMLDAWIMGLLTTEELEGLCSWLVEDLSPERRIEIETDVLYDWQNRLAAEDDPERNDEEDDDPRFRSTPEERLERREQRIRQEVESGYRGAEQEIRQQRLVALQETFTVLSVINSMSMAGSFGHDTLRSLLVETILPKHLRPEGVSGTTTGPDPSHMMKGLLRLQELDAIDHEQLRSAIEASATPEDAWKVMASFIEHVLQHCVEQSLSSTLPVAISDVARIMEQASMTDPQSADETLQQEVSRIRTKLEEDLRRIWQDAPFVHRDIVERLMSTFRIPEYAELFPHLITFNQKTLPEHLAIIPEDRRFGSIYETNAHSARMFTFMSGRFAQKWLSMNGGGSALEELERRHGKTSHVDMTGGVELIRSLSPERDEPTAEENRNDVLASIGAGVGLREFQERVDRWRLAEIPLGPVGGRWHFGNPVSDKHLELFKQVLQLGSTPFRMIHANESLIIPGFMSRNEMRLFIMMLAFEGLVDPNKPELQIGITGRLSKKLCAYFGSSCMLGTAECAPFKIDSFVPDEHNHNLTAARIVAYDAYPESRGKRRNFELPFMFDGTPDSGRNVSGRTDILGRWNIRFGVGDAPPDLWTMDDIDIAHTVGSVLRHVQNDGPLKGAGIAYMKRHRQILEQYGIADTLDAPWVYTREGEAYEDSSKNPEHFNRCVKACMDVHFDHARNFAKESGAVFDVRQNIDTLMRQVETVGAEILKDPRYEKDVRAILQSTSYESLHS